MAMVYSSRASRRHAVAGSKERIARTHAALCDHIHDYETFRTPPLMPRRTIRMADEGWWRRRRGDDVRGTANVQQLTKRLRLESLQ